MGDREGGLMEISDFSIEIVKMISNLCCDVVFY